LGNWQLLPPGIPDKSCRIANYNCTRCHIICHDTSCPNHAPAPNGHAFENEAVHPDKDIILDDNWCMFSGQKITLPFCRVKWVKIGVSNSDI
jgi:hypothetical protein